MNKKGFLLAEETLKIVIALICIGLLAFLVVSLYLSFTKSRELDQAKSTLPFIMNAVKQSDTSVDVYNPDSWWISSWPQFQDQVPNSCSSIGLQSCICICKEDSLEGCNSDGVCQDNAGFRVQGAAIQITKPPITLTIDQQNKIIRKK